MASLSTRPVGQPTQLPRSSPQTTSAQFLYYTLALVAIVVAVCVVSFCYKNLYFPKTFCCKKNQDIESITETEAVVECGANYANIDSTRLEEFHAIYDHGSSTDSSKGKRLLWTGESGPLFEGGTTDTVIDESPTATEVDLESRQLASDNLHVRRINVMTAVHPTSTVIDRYLNPVLSFVPLLSDIAMMFCDINSYARSSLVCDLHTFIIRHFIGTCSSRGRCLN